MSKDTIELSKATMDGVAKLLLEGLTTDGAHHKQWYLESVLEMLTGIEWVQAAHKEFQWEEGIAP